MIDERERPMSRYEQEAGLAAERRRDTARTAAMLLVMSGSGPFWRVNCSPMSQWDNEQEFAIAAAVREALAQELDAPDAWEHVKARVLREGQKWADYVAEDV